MKKVTLKTIADEFGVSVVTVHKALKNQYGVSPEMRQKILDYATKLGYVSPSSLTELHFAFIIQKDFLVSTDEQYYTAIYYYLNQECIKAGAQLHMILHDSTPRTAASFRALQAESHLDGIFIAGQVEKPLLTQIAGLNIPVACIDFYSSDYPFGYVYVDNYYASYTLTKYLIKRGHSRICFVGDIKFSRAIADRYYGFLRALNCFDIEEPPMHVNRNIERSFDPAEFAFETMPTAFICHCDRAAGILYAYLRDKGYSIPNDCSVISFDNTETSRILTPALSSMGVDKSIYALQAFRLMRQTLQKRSDMLNYIKINLELFERDSVRDLTEHS